MDIYSIYLEICWQRSFKIGWLSYDKKISWVFYDS